MAGSFVIGLGAGVIILLVLWTTVLIAWIQLTPEQGGLRTGVTLLSTLVTVILLLIPTETREPGEIPSVVNPDLILPQDAFQVYDYMFIWKGILMALMTLGIISAFGVYLKEFWATKVHGSLPVPANKSTSSSEYE